MADSDEYWAHVGFAPRPTNRASGRIALLEDGETCLYDAEGNRQLVVKANGSILIFSKGELVVSYDA